MNKTSLNKGYKDILSKLTKRKVKFLLIGAYAMEIQGCPRPTTDMDVWVMPDATNAKQLFIALEEIGVPTMYLKAENMQKEKMTFQVGITPRRTIFMTSLDGLKFQEAFSNSKKFNIDGISVNVLSVPDLIKNKRSTGRPKDFSDANDLEKLNVEKKK